MKELLYFDWEDFYKEVPEVQVILTFRLKVQLIKFLLGIFFVLPCIETYQKVDLRTITLDVPPQEVSKGSDPFLSDI